MPLTIKVHEKRIAEMWWTDALEILKGEAEGDKEEALKELTYSRGYWVVTLPRKGHIASVVKLGKCRTEQDAIRKVKKYAPKNQIYDIDDTKPIKAVRVLYDEDELPAEYKCPPEYRDW